MGPHGGLNLRAGTGCPAPHWNLELGRPFGLKLTKNFKILLDLLFFCGLLIVLMLIVVLFFKVFVSNSKFFCFNFFTSSAALIGS